MAAGEFAGPAAADRRQTLTTGNQMNDLCMACSMSLLVSFVRCGFTDLGWIAVMKVSIDFYGIVTLASTYSTSNTI